MALLPVCRCALPHNEKGRAAARRGGAGRRVTLVTATSGAAAQVPGKRATQGTPEVGTAAMMTCTFDPSPIYDAGETAAAWAVVALFLPRDTHIAKEDCAEAVRRLVRYYADEGPGRETLLAEIENMAQCVGAITGVQRAGLLQ